MISGLKGPLGLAWYRDTLYVASIGRVDAFSDLHGTRFADRRTVLREPAGHGWNDNLVAAPDGRLVMSISANCDHCTPQLAVVGGDRLVQPDGSDVRFYARRLRAGYGLAYYPGTSRLLVTMNQRNDLGARTPGDWLAGCATARAGASRPATARAARLHGSSEAESPCSTSTPPPEGSR